MSKTKLGLIFVAMACSITLFQNCAESLPDQVYQNLPSASSNNFKSGETFDYSRVTNQSQMVQTMLTSYNYMTASGSKAVAIAASGLGFVALSQGTQADANLAALAGCYHITGGMPCALLVEGNLFKAAGSALDYSYRAASIQGPYGATTVVPFLSSAAHATLFSSYASAPEPKAIAISLDGTVVPVTNTNLTVGYNGTPASIKPIAAIGDARQAALERCEMMATITPCSILAENMNIVLSLGSPERSPQLSFSLASVTRDVMPGQTKNVIVSEINNRYLTSTSPGSIWISANGKYGLDKDGSATTASANAKRTCENGNTELALYPCIEYGASAGISSAWNPTNVLRAYRNNPSLHCKAVPRVSCAAHRSVGCPAGGQYYTTMSGLTLETCN